MLRLAVFVLLLVAPLKAQVSNFDFSALAEKAKSKTEIHLDAASMELMKVKAPEVLRGSDIKAISVHAYEYEKAGDYPPEALEALRKQVAADPRWSKMLSARERDESTDIYLKKQDGKVTGLLLIAAERDEVTIIQTEGAVEVAQLQEVVKSAIQYDIASAGNVGK